MIFHYGYAPWNDLFWKRKTQIKEKVSSGDKARNWGFQHFRGHEELNIDFQKQSALSLDLNSHPFANIALKRWS